MPQIQRTEASKQELVNSEQVPFKQRLMDLFRAQDYVRVKNIDNEPYQWQYMPTDAEETIVQQDATKITTGRPSFNSDYTRMIGGKEQFWQIAPGAEEVILGENAYVMIEGLYKRLVAKAAINKNPDAEVRQYNWTDVTMQREIIGKIFLGVERPTFGANTQDTTLGEETEYVPVEIPAKSTRK